MVDVFASFEGGREGVIQRFRKLVLDRIENLKFSEVSELEESADLPAGSFRRLAEGDLGMVTAKAIQTLADPLDYSMEDVFGTTLTLDKDTRAAIMREMLSEKFVSVAAAGAEGGAPNNLTVFVIVKALREL